jgi:hypothetical protein
MTLCIHPATRLREKLPWKNSDLDFDMAVFYFPLEVFIYRTLKDLKASDTFSLYLEKKYVLSAGLKISHSWPKGNASKVSDYALSI